MLPPSVEILPALLQGFGTLRKLASPHQLVVGQPSDHPDLTATESVLRPDFRYLGQEHAVSITEKPVALPDRMAVGRQNLLPPGEGTHQDKQTGLWQMKVS